MTRAPALDLVRIAAALLVFVGHASQSGSVDMWPLSAHPHIGVLVFFALSGYLVYRPFLYRRVAVTEHYIRRFVRLAPAYVAAVIAIGLVAPSETTRLLLVSWSLFVEVAFYALLPAIARLTRNRELPAIAALGAASFLICLVMPSALMPVLATPILVVPYFWTFAFGMALAILERDRRLPGRAAVPAGAVVALTSVVLARSQSWDNPLFELPAVAGATLAIAGALTWRLPSGTRAVAMLADASYPFYLCHWTAISLAVRVFGGGAASFGAAMVGGGAVSVVCMVAVERPVRALWSRARERDGVTAARTGEAVRTGSSMDPRVGG